VGTFTVAFQVGDPQGQNWEWVEGLVDTGASYSWVPGSVLAGLGVQASFQVPFILTDGRRFERGVAETRLRLDGEERATLIVLGDEGTQPLIGAYMLEGFRLSPDPVNRRLVPVPGVLM
jgi:predicted aspartyl protease